MSEPAEIVPPTGAGNRVINQGDIYWITFYPVYAGPEDATAGADGARESAIPHPCVPHPCVPHPYVIVQDDLFNHSRIHTVVVCALTSNLHRAGETPGNVLLDAGEANLPKQSVVEVSKVSSVEKARLGAYVGTLSAARVHQILAGMRFLQKTFFAR
ncbi:MAG: type II toxin-antitoxin system PemK/MazF family toxin [Litorilinea sp.]